MTGIEIQDSSAGIYDDGEWISWSYINEQLAKQDARQRHRSKQPQTPVGQATGKMQKVSGMFDRLLNDAKLYYQSTGRHLLIYGELGELYAEMRFGISRHKPFAEGSDGRLGNDFVEVKTISPLAKKQQIRVKRSAISASW